MQEQEWNDKVAALARQCAELEKVRDHGQEEGDHGRVVADLSAELARAYAEIEELQNSKDCNEECIKCLESTLAAMERQAKVSSANPAKAHSAAVSKQLVQCTLAQREAQRRLKVAARQALDYEQRLAEQASRIQQLKGNTPPRPGNGCRASWNTATQKSSRRRAVSLSPSTGGTEPGSLQQGSVCCTAFARNSTLRCRAAMPECDMPGCLQTYKVPKDSYDRELSMTASELHITLARKNAEIDSLRKSLASFQASALAPNAQVMQSESEHDAAAEASEYAICALPSSNCRLACCSLTHS
jgi:hypothetical protein